MDMTEKFTPKQLKKLYERFQHEEDASGEAL
jgi:hypothetical protein